MKRALGVAAAASLLATAAHAGGVERSAFSTAILFEDGTYGEFSFGLVSPSVSGVQAIDFGGASEGAESGDIFETYTLWSLGFKTDLTDRISVAVIIDQPIGADTVYSPSDYALGLGPGSSAVLDNIGVTALAKYRFPNNISVYGGLRALQTKGTVSLNSGYTLETSRELNLGYVLGAAWERPEIAARVALSYVSAITQTFEATENGSASLPFSTTIPQQIKLEAQTGIAEDTLLFGSVNWTDWSVFDITPVGYNASTDSSLVDLDGDTFTFSLGVGRRFNEQWSGAVIGTYEPKVGGLSGNLGPTDGRTSLGVAATYSPNDRVEITGGLTYALIGGTSTGLGDFDGNSAVAAGVRLGFNY